MLRQKVRDIILECFLSSVAIRTSMSVNARKPPILDASHCDLVDAFCKSVALWLHISIAIHTPSSVSSYGCCSSSVVQSSRSVCARGSAAAIMALRAIIALFTALEFRGHPAARQSRREVSFRLCSTIAALSTHCGLLCIGMPSRLLPLWHAK